MQTPQTPVGNLISSILNIVIFYHAWGRQVNDINVWVRWGLQVQIVLLPVTFRHT